MKSLSIRTWGKWIAEALILFYIIVVISYWQTRSLAQGAVPEGLYNNDNPRIHWRDNLVTDKPVLIYFWASWCPVCGLSQDSIDRLSDDFALISIATQSGDQQSVAAYMEKEGISFPVIIDEGGELAAYWGVPGFPAAFIVDEKDRIRFSTMGYTTEWGLRARLWLAD